MATASETGQDNGSFGKSSDFLAGDNSPKATLSSKHKADKKGHRPRGRQEDGLPYFGHSVTRINPLQWQTLGAFWQQVGSQRSTSSQESQISDDSQRSDYAAVGPVGMNQKGSSSASVSAHKTAKAPINCRTEEKNKSFLHRMADSGYEAVGAVGMEKKAGSSSRDTRPDVTSPSKHHGQKTETTRTEENLKPGMSGQCHILDMSQKIHDSQKAKEDLKPGMSGKYDTLALSQMIHDSQKTKSTLKKRCKWGLLILLCMGVSVLLALTSLNNKETKQIASIKDDLPQKSTFKKQKQDLSVMKKILERLKSKFLDKTDFSENCVNDCRQVSSDGNYQSCYTCEGYVSCTGPKLDNMSCPLADSNSNRYLVWDDANKTCTYNSSTC